MVFSISIKSLGQEATGVHQDIRVSKIYGCLLIKNINRGQREMNLVDKYNAFVGFAVAALTAAFGVYWYLFAGYLLFNILDWITGWYKARKLKKESSKTGIQGIMKKAGYWVIILVAFMMSDILISLGRDILEINLDFLMMFGWFTLAALLVNEIRSILENLVECGYDVPSFLIKGLAVTEKLIHTQTDKDGGKGW